MKKLLSLTALVVLLLVALTGCVNVNYELSLDKKGGANVAYSYEADKEYLDYAEFDDMKEKAKNEGYAIEEYETDKYQRFKATKKFDNASDVSLEKVFGEDYAKDTEEGKLKVEKEGSKTLISQNTEIDLTNVEGSIKYTVKLPAKAESNNANVVSEDGKTLTWELTPSGKNTIQYSATVKGLGIVPIICIVVAVVVVAGVVCVVVMKCSKKEEKEVKKEEPKKEAKATKKDSKKEEK